MKEMAAQFNQENHRISRQQIKVEVYNRVGEQSDDRPRAYRRNADRREMPTQRCAFFGRLAVGRIKPQADL
jgi:hypothetical protein